MKNNKIAFVINHITFFVSHFLPLAIKLKNNGFQVKVFSGISPNTKIDNYSKNILKNYSIDYEVIKFKVDNLNILNEIKHILNFRRKLKYYDPKIIYAISLKGIFYSMISYMLVKPNIVINYFTGLGYFFTNKLNIFERTIKKIIILMLKVYLKKKTCISIIENRYDKKFLYKLKISKKQIYKFDGTGVDINKFNYRKKNKKKIILFPARILIEKGIIEYAEATKILHKEDTKNKWKFIAIGSLSYVKKNNSHSFINSIKKKYKHIHFVGHTTSAHKYFNMSHIVCLPSYREGFPKSLVEASSSGCAIITTNVPGCNEVVLDNYNGLLSKPKNIKNLYLNIKKLANDPRKIRLMSINSRKLAIKKFKIETFINKNYELIENAF